MVLRVIHRPLWPLLAVVGLLIAMLSLPVSATETPAQLLVQADTLRVTDPVRSRQILQALKNQSLTPEEQDYRDYLQGFHIAVSSDSLRAVSFIEPISQRHPNDELGLRTRSTLLSIYFGYRDWSEGLLLSTEIKQMLERLPRNNTWYTANLSVVIYYMNLHMYNEALQLLERVTGPELGKVSAEMRCRYIAQEFRAQKGLDISAITPRWLATLEAACLPLTDTLYTVEPFITWTRYLLDVGQYEAVLLAVRRYERAIIDLNYFYYVVAIKNIEAQALFALGHYPEAEAIIEPLLARPELADYSEGLITAASLKAKIRSQQHDYEQAYHWQQVAIESERSQNRLAATKQLAVNNAQATVRQADEDLRLLSNNQALLANQLARSEQNVIGTYLLIALAISLMFITVFSIRKLQKQQQLLARIASTDSLTGLDNRREFLQVTQQALRGNDTEEPLSLIMFDLDNLKWINDNYGHQAGDWVLSQIGKVLTARLTVATVSCARVGGEEFVLCLKGTNVNEALAYCHEIQCWLAAIDTKAKLDGLQLSASFGVCDTNQVGKQLDSLISGADLAMYKAKKAGRRQAVKYPMEQGSKKEAI